MRMAVLGCGRWGSFVAWYIHRLGHQTALYGRPSSAAMRNLIEYRKNDLLSLPPAVSLRTTLDCVQDADVILISINAQNLQALINELSPLHVKNKTFVLCMKGLEINSGRRLSEIVTAGVHHSNAIAVWLGPGHVQEFITEKPNCMVIDSIRQDTKAMLVDALSSKLIRFYYGQDLIGNEIGAAAKNVIGIAAGMLDGLHLSTLKGALMSRGTREVARLITSMGGNELSAYGLCHLGDYEATVFSKYSHNRRFGEDFILGNNFTKLAEGYTTVKAMCRLGNANGVDLPICEALHRTLYQQADPKETLQGLFTRSLKKEF